jgi:hypothetical protein
MPGGYGADTAKVYLEWSDVTEALADSLHYWLSTTRPDGRPHVVPRWGVWLDDVFWYDGSPETIHVRNLDTNPYCALHLESGKEAVILEGRSIVPDAIVGDLGERLSAEYARKYAPQYVPSADQWAGELSGGMRVIAPERAIAWKDFPNDLTRFTF